MQLKVCSEDFTNRLCWGYWAVRIIYTIFGALTIFLLITAAAFAASYTVRPSDSLFTIGQRYGVSYTDLMQVNGLRDSEIYPGQVLTIPGDNTLGPVSDRDFDALARIITAEADNQAFEVKVAVGAVILNRVRSAIFPNTIYNVIYDDAGGYIQFEPVLNGWINRPASGEATRAAHTALDGEDPSWGALYFFEPWVTNRFLLSLPVARDLGAFRFAYDPGALTIDGITVRLFLNQNEYSINRKGVQTKAFLDVAPLLQQETVFVPLRGVLNQFGATLHWNAGERTVNIVKQDKRIDLPVGSSSALVNGRSVSLQVPARIVNGRTLIPLRFVSEGLDLKVNWDSRTKSITISL